MGSIAAYARRVRRVDLDGIDFDAFRSQPLDEGALRCLRYMYQIESHTVCYLRDLLVTRAHRDPELTTFLTCWAFEEQWHGEALGAVLRAHGESVGPATVALTRRRLGWADGLRPLGFVAASALFGEDLSAVHMTWGALNEWTTQAGYARLAAVTGHPILAELLSRIMRQEGTHIDVYASEARRRLAGSARARRLTRFALARFWAPVGSGVMPDSEVAHLVRYLFDGPGAQEVVERIDRRVGSLPGLAGLAPVRRAVERYRAA